MGIKSKPKRKSRRNTSRPCVDGRVAGRPDVPAPAGTDVRSGQSSSLVPSHVSSALLKRCPSGLDVSVENLPVLNAFSEFLDIERRTTRRRIASVLLIFTLLLCAAVAAGIMFGREMLQRVQNELEVERVRSGNLQRSMEAQLNGVSAVAGEIQESMALKDIRARHDHAALKNYLDAQTSTVFRMQDNMSALELEIAMLENKLHEMSARVPSSLTPPLPFSGDGNDDFQEIEARIADDFALLRRLTDARREQFRNVEKAFEPEIGSRETPLRQSGAGSDFDLKIDSPEGEVIPWRLRFPRP